jgi:tetratricopeptide (TPR) repeat protein
MAALSHAAEPREAHNLPVVRQALDRLYRMDYPGAEETILAGLPPSSPARPYYAGTICLNRFLDGGDTAALARAERYLEKLSPNGGPSTAPSEELKAELRLYRGLAGFQQSYIASLRGQRVRPAALAHAARKQLLPLGAPEARATLILYDYYRSQILGKLPLFEATELPLAEFQRTADASPLRDLFLSSLFWIHVDKGRIEPALRIADGFLERYPGNRLAREMRGSALYRGKRFAEARAEYEALREEYQWIRKSPERLPLGYYRAVGNLARIYAALGMRPEAEARLAEWNRAGPSGAGPWLPASLREDLAGR